MIDQRLEMFRQLFSWTTAEQSKYPIDKMIGLQGPLTVSEVSCVPFGLAENSITEIFSKRIYLILNIGTFFLSFK